MNRLIRKSLDLLGWDSPRGQAQPSTMDMAGRASGTRVDAPQVDGPAFNTKDFPPPGIPFSPYYRDVAPRSWDYPASLNLNRQPRATEDNSFALLDGVAKRNDVVQYCIRARTDELTSMPWRFVARDPEMSGHPMVRAAIQSACRFFEQPNRDDGLWWDGWLTQVHYDICVIDALTLYPQRDRLGRIHSFVQVDGKTIKPLIDTFGRVPRPPYPAYQQVIAGIIRGEYTRDEMLYRPTNPQVDSPYGRSIVEMCLMHVVTGIRRWAFNLGYYTEGTLPQMFIQVPDVNPENVQAWLELMNETLAGDDAARWRFVPLPKDANAQEVRQPVWDSSVDEWITRVICALFNVNPMPFVTMMNRSTAEVAENQQYDLGLKPVKRSIASLVTELEEIRSGHELVKFQWVEDKTEISTDRANVLKLFMDEGLLRRNYVREEVLGLDPDDELEGVPLGPLQAGSPEKPTSPPAPAPESPEKKSDDAPVDFTKAASSELATWKRIAKRHGFASEKAVGFEAKAIPSPVAAEIRRALFGARTQEEAEQAFDRIRSDKARRMFRTEAELDSAIKAYLRHRAPALLTRQPEP